MLSQEKNCYLGINGKKHGPISEADIQKLYDNKKITGDIKFARLGDTQWITVSEVGIFTPPLPDEIDELPPLPPENNFVKPIGTSKPQEKMPKKQWLLIFGGTIVGFAVVLIIAVVVGTTLLNNVPTPTGDSIASAGQGSSGSGSSSPVSQRTTHQDTMQVAGFQLSDLEYEVLLGIGVVRYSFRNTTSQPIQAMFQTEMLDATGERIGRAGATDMFNSAHQPRTTLTVTSELGDVTRDSPVYGSISVILFNEMGFPEFDNIPSENVAFFEFLPNNRIAFLAPGQVPNFRPSGVSVDDASNDLDSDEEDYTATTPSTQDSNLHTLTSNDIDNLIVDIVNTFYSFRNFLGSRSNEASPGIVSTIENLVDHDLLWQDLFREARVWDFYWLEDMGLQISAVNESPDTNNEFNVSVREIAIDLVPNGGGAGYLSEIWHTFHIVINSGTDYYILDIHSEISSSEWVEGESGGGSASSPLQHDILGRWTLTLGNTISTFEFRADGTYTNTGSSPLGTHPTGTGRFEVVGDTIIITRDRDGSTAILNIRGNELFMGDSVTPYRRVGN